MQGEMVCQGRSVSATELGWLQKWVDDHRQWSRHRLSVELCRHWQWETAVGRLKNYAARSFLLKLEQRGLLKLPPIREEMRRQSWLTSFAARIDFLPEPVTATLSALLPVRILLCSSGSPEEFRFRSYLATLLPGGLMCLTPEEALKIYREGEGVVVSTLCLFSHRIEDLEGQ